ncbi:MAG: hypothetical protein V3T71_02970 [Dehalococcoidia bacterium]
MVNGRKRFTGGVNLRHFEGRGGIRPGDLLDAILTKRLSVS